MPDKPKTVVPIYTAPPQTPKPSCGKCGNGLLNTDGTCPACGNAA